MNAPAYNPNRARPGDPVPFARLVTMLRFCSARHWDFYRGLTRDEDRAGAQIDPLKWLDLDVALPAAAKILEQLAELAEIHGDERVRAWLDAAVEKARAGRAA